MRLGKIYLISSLLPIILLFIEKYIPLNTLANFTSLEIYIKNENIIYTLPSLVLIIITFFIIKIFYKEKFFLLTLKESTLVYLLIYSLLRLFNTIYLSYYLGANLTERIIAQELVVESRAGIYGIFIGFINVIYPLILFIISYYLFTLRLIKFPLKKENKHILYSRTIIFICLITALLNDSIRFSRGNLFYFIASIISAYLLSKSINKNLFNDQISLLQKKGIFRFNSTLLISLLAFAAIIFVSISRHYIENLLIDENISILKILHDSTLIKVLGGQIVTNQLLSDQVFITTSTKIQLQDIDLTVSSLDFLNTYKRDQFCAIYNCFEPYPPINFFHNLFGSIKNRMGSMYFLIYGNNPYNAGSHLGSILFIFGKNIGIVVYPFLIYLNCLFSRVNNNYIKFISQFNLLYFCIFLFTDNWFLKLQPYLYMILGFTFLPLIGLKLHKIAKQH